MADWLSTSGILALSAATITAGAAFYMATRPQPFESPIDLTNQSQQVPGIPSARMSWLCKDGKLIEYFNDVTTFYEGFRRGARVSDNGNCLGWKPSRTEPFKWLKYNEVLEEAEAIGSGFIYKGIQPLNSSRIGIYSKNTPQCVITDLACATYSMVLVPVYDTLDPDTCTFIITQASINLVVCDTTERVMKLLKSRFQTPGLKIIVCFETLTSELKQLADEAKVGIMTFDELANLGKEHHHMPKPCIPSDVSTICYTSGTTGTPKGAMITHRNLMLDIAGIAAGIAPIQFGPDDVYLSFLPIAHVYEKCNQTFLFTNGSQCGFYQGDMLRLMDDLHELRPTFFAAVPRLLNRVYDKIIAKVSKNFVSNYIFQMAYNSKLGEIKRGVIRKNSIWDMLVFRKVQESFGGRIRVAWCAGSPLSQHVISFIRVALGCFVFEGYGMTECIAVANIVPGDTGTGYVGPPTPTAIVKLIDVPEMDYFATNQQGEVCVKGANVFVGYLNEPKKTAEAIDSDGWLHTGDIGMWLPNGTLKIVDRKKNIFKLAQGEYIAPEKIENIYMRSEVVVQIMIHGDSLKATLVAIVVPDPDELSQWVKMRLKINGSSVAELCAQPEVKQAILEDMVAIGKKAGLHSFEQVRDIYFTTMLFSTENGLLTPTQKLKRHNIRKYYAKQIKEMYLHLE